ncbi:MAG: PhzF family phenazine biosynthesis protein [Saprospiraceae bacterium]|jgi:PhzF family phenazine biosynthesis protein
MTIDCYQIDAFTDQLFKGNPAAVCVLDEWLEDTVMQNIAAENNLAETAFILRSGEEFDLRWFTPAVEIDLCGHATLASAFVVFHYLGWDSQRVQFNSMSGPLVVDLLDNGSLQMDFPARAPSAVSDQNIDQIIERAFDIKPSQVLGARDLLLIFESEGQVKQLSPDLSVLAEITDYFAVIVSAPGQQCDFVSRFFAPNAGIPEDPVTGSAHCTLVPYWAEQLNKQTLSARQLSPRGGELACTLDGSRVKMSGQAKLFLKGQITL